MEFKLEQATEILGRTPETLKSLLGTLPDNWIMSNEGAGSWSPFDVLVHLIHGEETNWIPRARMILEHGQSRPFDPFNPTATFETSKGKSLAELLEAFELVREKNLESLKQMNLNAEQLETKGTHPAIGEVTLEQLLATWVVHDLSHIGQIVRTMCRQYETEVGPWKAYIRILNR